MKIKNLLINCLFFVPCTVSGQFYILDGSIRGYAYRGDSLIVDGNHHIGYRFYQFDSTPLAEYYFHADKNKYHCRHYEINDPLPEDEDMFEEPVVAFQGEILYGPEYWIEHDTIVVFDSLTYEEKVKIRGGNYRDPIRVGYWVEHEGAGNYAKGDYLNGRRDGIWTLWDDDRVLLETKWYKNGELLRDSAHNILETNDLDKTTELLCNAWDLDNCNFLSEEGLFYNAYNGLAYRIDSLYEAYNSQFMILQKSGDVAITIISDHKSERAFWTSSREGHLKYIYRKKGTFKLLGPTLLELNFEEGRYQLVLQFLSDRALRFSFSK